MDKLYSINCYLLVVVAILTIMGSIYASYGFIFTSTIGLSEAIKRNLHSSKVINITFIVMNLIIIMRG